MSDLASTSLTLDDDAIYYASIPVFFASVAGETIPFIASEWRENPSSLPAALARFSLVADPEGGLPFVHPAIPAIDFNRYSDTSSSAAAAEAIPPQLRQPLIKVPECLALPPPNTIRGFASGTRSALIKLDGHW
jgi:hypothetical protein